MTRRRPRDGWDAIADGLEARSTRLLLAILIVLSLLPYPSLEAALRPVFLVAFGLEIVLRLVVLAKGRAKSPRAEKFFLVVDLLAFGSFLPLHHFFDAPRRFLRILRIARLLVLVRFTPRAGRRRLPSADSPGAAAAAGPGDIRRGLSLSFVAALLLSNLEVAHDYDGVRGPRRRGLLGPCLVGVPAGGEPGQPGPEPPRRAFPHRRLPGADDHRHLRLLVPHRYRHQRGRTGAPRGAAAPDRLPPAHVGHGRRARGRSAGQRVRGHLREEPAVAPDASGRDRALGSRPGTATPGVALCRGWRCWAAPRTRRATSTSRACVGWSTGTETGATTPTCTGSLPPTPKRLLILAEGEGAAADALTVARLSAFRSVNDTAHTFVEVRESANAELARAVGGPWTFVLDKASLRRPVPLPPPHRPPTWRRSWVSSSAPGVARSTPICSSTGATAKGWRGLGKGASSSSATSHDMPTSTSR